MHTPSGAVVHFAPDGMRHVESGPARRPVVFASGNGRGGYVQHPFMVHNQPFVQRTYVDHGVVVTRVYRPYVYMGVTYNVYTPTHYYRPAYLQLAVPSVAPAGPLQLGLGPAALVRLLPRLLDTPIRTTPARCSG